MGLEGEIVFADLAIIHIFLRTVAIPGIFEVVYPLAIEGNEPNSLSKKLIMENRCIFNDANEMRGKSRHFRKEDPAEGVSKADIAVVEDELDFFLTNLQNLATNFGHENIEL